MVIAGISTKTEYDKYVWQKMINSFTANLSLPNILLEGLLPESYMQLYEYADICLIPLENSDWHSCKSNIKILECACKKAPVIVSNVEPYSRDIDAPVLWVNNQKDWYKHIKRLLNNEEERKEYGERLYEWARSKYELTSVNSIRKRAFESLI